MSVATSTQRRLGDRPTDWGARAAAAGVPQPEPENGSPSAWCPASAPLRLTSIPTIPIALLGCGTIGSCVARQLIERRDEIRTVHGVDLDLRAILVRDPARKRGDITRATGRFVDSIDDVIAARPRLVIELLGGCVPAAAHIRRCLDAGIHIITANKTVMAHHGTALRALAAARGVHIAHEASVAAAIPILNSLRHLVADRVYSVKGILNGTTNYILTRMHDNGLSMTEALTEAKERGLIEPDPSADLSGRDAAEKLAILATHIGLDGIAVNDIDTTGIESIRTDDILAARRLGYVLRLVAHLDRTAEGVSMGVGPALLPRNHPLAQVQGADNGLIIRCRFAGDLFLLGQGAGPEPTTSAILGDLLRVVRESRLHDEVTSNSAPPLRSVPFDAKPGVAAVLRPRCHFLRVNMGSRRRDGESSSCSPRRLFQALRQHGVSTREVEIRPDAARVLTHPATTGQVRLVVEEIMRSASPDASLIAPVLDETDNAEPVSHAIVGERSAATVEPVL